MNDNNNADPKYNPTFNELRGEPLAGDSTHGYFTADDGTKIFYEYWAPKDRPVEKIVIGLHGMAAHSRYLAFAADLLVPHGVAVAVLDYRCHGLSGGCPGDLTDPMLVVSDAKKLCCLMREKFPGAPIFTLGESMGGAVNIILNTDPPEGLRGIVLIAPAIAPAYNFSLKQILLGVFYIFTYLVRPGARVIKVTGEEPRAMRSALNIKYDQEDPLHLKYVSPRFLLKVKALVDLARKEGAKGIKVPVLAIQGGKDVAVDADAVRNFIEQLPIEDKTFKFIPEGTHCMPYDPELSAEVRALVRDWILAH